MSNHTNEEFKTRVEQIKALRERNDGSLSRLIGVEVFGMTHEEADTLGWGRYEELEEPERE